MAIGYARAYFILPMTVYLLQEGLLLTILLTAPVMAVSLLVGLVVSFFQAATQMQDHTLSFVPKMIAVFVTLLLTGGWMMQHLTMYAQRVLAAVASPIS